MTPLVYVEHPDDVPAGVLLRDWHSHRQRSWWQRFVRRMNRRP